MNTAWPKPTLSYLKPPSLTWMERKTGTCRLLDSCLKWSMALSRSGHIAPELEASFLKVYFAERLLVYSNYIYTDTLLIIQHKAHSKMVPDRVWFTCFNFNLVIFTLKNISVRSGMRIWAKTQRFPGPRATQERKLFQWNKNSREERDRRNWDF